METLYQTRLSNSQIRLLHVLPSETPESPISCELRQYEVDNVPPYEALSYCRGDSNDQREIICNGSTHLVTTSLRDALVRLRLTDEVRIVWADALCIAQFDDEEKSSQVRRMDLIYHRAKRVVVWLGHVEREHSSNIKRLYESLELVSDYEDCEHPWHIADVRANFGTSLPWNSIRLFFENPWFRRMWCIQEIRLASGSVFYWGTEQFSKHVGVRLGRWHQCVWREQSPHTPTILSIYTWRMNSPLTLDKCCLLQALSTYRRWHASDRRDKVYGILGLVELGEERRKIPIDYEKSAADVFHDVATAVIRWTGDLAIFDHVHHNVDYDGHPEYESWVPQWDQWEDIPAGSIRGRLYPTSSAYGVYKSTASHEAITQPCGRQLVVSGTIYEAVSYANVLIADAFSELSTVQRFDGTKFLLYYPVHIFLDYWRQKVSQEAPKDSELSPEMKTMARTLTAGVVRFGSHYHEASEEDVTEYLQSFLDYIKLLYALSEHVAEDGSIRYDFSRSGPGWQLFASTACYNHKGRTLFRAKDGSVGLGPACLRRGDLIVVIEGAYAPVALRPRGENYLLLGQVYHDDIMNGELIDEIEKGVRKPQHFCLV